VKEYQSYGAGVNSVALAEVLHYKPERVFADPGCEYPETYEYLKGYPHEVTTLHPIVEECSNIEEWCHKLGHAPFSQMRSCSVKWKHRPMEKYMKPPCTVHIGIAYDERHRVKVYEKNTRRGKFYYSYPLVEQGITRAQCVEIIHEAGLQAPPKSGCWFCPQQSKASWWRLGRQHPDLFWRAVAIDDLSDKVKLWEGTQAVRGLRALWPPQTVFEEEEGWECQLCMLTF